MAQCSSLYETAEGYGCHRAQRLAVGDRSVRVEARLPERQRETVLISALQQQQPAC
jgi:hypothetical protein